MKNSATMQDVADAAGVSKATVSNVFNQPDRVRPLVREKVEAAAYAIGYGGPNPVARLLNSGKVNMIGFVPPAQQGIGGTFITPYIIALLRGVTQVCEEYGVSLALISGLADKRKNGLENAIVDGFILGTPDDFAIAKRRNLPCVVMDFAGSSNFSSVSVDNTEGARLVTQHLLDLGHTRFAIMSNMQVNGLPAVDHKPTGNPAKLVAANTTNFARLDGISQALGTAGLSLHDFPIIESNPAHGSLVGGASEAAKMLLDTYPSATAIVALTDYQAKAVLNEARRRGIKVPEELSIVGYDDEAGSNKTLPPMTTVAQPTHEKGRAAARLVLGGGDIENIVLPVELVVRGSSGPAPK